MRERKAEGVKYTLVGDNTRVDDGEFLAIGIAKDGDGDDDRIACRGSWDACDEWAERNDSPDNHERYIIGKVVEDG